MVIKNLFYRYYNLKKTVFIFVLIISKITAQINAPELRCLEVKNNGDVKLTWIPPSDPGNIFDSYEIFSSFAFNGPYSSIGTIGAIVINTFTHVGAGADIQSKYYFIKTKFNPGGTGSSSNSDTLRSIFLNAIQSTPDVKLQYNNLHLPKLNSSSSTFTLSKEYPSTVWNNLGTTTNLNYADTISVCSASLNYQVSLNDASGCVSLSNIQGGIFNDAKAPDQPSVDSISVLPNGQTVISWNIPKDLDITKYRIYYLIGGINQEIDSVIGRNNNIYTYTTTTANNQAVSLFVSAIDSCKKIGSFDTKPTTMHLQTTYNTCAYSTNLNWNAYKGMKNGISEYRIYYSINGSAFLAVGSTTQTSFVHDGVTPGQNVCYFVRVFNNDKSISSSSNRKCFFSTQAQAPTYVYISSASVLSHTSVEIKLYLDISRNAQGIELNRSLDGINFNSITYLPFNGSAIYLYVDENIDTKAHSYIYRAIVKDSCGNPRIKSNDSKTILLKVNDDKEMIFNKNLKWTDYKGFAGGVSGYNIYRIINDAVTGSIIATTGPFDTTYVDNLEDEAPYGSKIEYWIQAVEGISNPYGFFEQSHSNTEIAYMEAKIFVPNAFAREGINKIWLPITHFVDKSEYSLVVFDKWGQEKFKTNDDRQGWDGKNAKPDVYVYQISYKNSRGEYIEQRGSFVML